MHAIINCNIPFVWYSVDILHENKNSPNPIDFHLWWPFRVKSLEKAIVKYGYDRKFKTKVFKTAELSEYNQQVNKIAKVIDPLLPYGKIDIHGKTFEAMSISGAIEFGEVMVYRQGRYVLLVKKYSQL